MIDISLDETRRTQEAEMQQATERRRQMDLADTAATVVYFLTKLPSGHQGPRNLNLANRGIDNPNSDEADILEFKMGEAYADAYESEDLNPGKQSYRQKDMRPSQFNRMIDDFTTRLPEMIKREKVEGLDVLTVDETAMERSSFPPEMKQRFTNRLQQLRQTPEREQKHVEARAAREVLSLYDPPGLSK